MITKVDVTLLELEVLKLSLKFQSHNSPRMPRFLSSREPGLRHREDGRPGRHKPTLNPSRDKTIFITIGRWTWAECHLSCQMGLPFHLCLCARPAPSSPRLLSRKLITPQSRNQTPHRYLRRQTDNIYADKYLRRK